MLALEPSSSSTKCKPCQIMSKVISSARERASELGMAGYSPIRLMRCVASVVGREPQISNLSRLGENWTGNSRFVVCQNTIWSYLSLLWILLFVRVLYIPCWMAWLLGVGLISLGLPQPIRSPSPS